jgi:hypothetical protein
MTTASFASSRQHQPFVLSRLQAVAALMVVFSFALDAPLRFVLGLAHVGPLLYMRDAFEVFIIGSVLFHWMMGGELGFTNKVIFVLLCHMFWGVIALGSPAQPVVALKSYVTFLFGAIVFEYVRRHEKALLWSSVALLAVTVFGVVLNYFMDMPWSGAVFETAAGDMALSKEWTSGGVSRIAGFTRVSWDAAIITVSAIMPIMCLQSLRWPWKWLLFAMAFGVVFLTTTKGAMIGLAGVGVFLCLHHLGKGQNKLSLPFFVAPLLVFALPLMAYLGGVSGSSFEQAAAILYSFVDRVTYTWPKAFELFNYGGNAIMGRGLGGIGLAQFVFEGSRANAADNFMLYVYVTFGVLGIFYVYRILFSLKDAASHVSRYLWGCVLGWLTFGFLYGMTTNIVDAPFFMFVFGLIAGASQFKKA